ncbi:hypothetical protein JYI40_23935, partial [Escherichia fergusonii]
KAGAHGLMGMRQRATALRGELRVHSRPGRGTLIEVVMPWTPDPAAGAEAASAAAAGSAMPPLGPPSASRGMPA